MYEIIEKIGRGAYGIVWKIRCKKTNQIFALKKNFDVFLSVVDS